MTVRSELLAILACPKCKKSVELSEDGDFLRCGNCRLQFPIRDDIPVMLIDEAQEY